MHSKKSLALTFLQQHYLLVIATFLLGLLANLFTLFLPIIIARSYELLFTLSSTRGKILDFLPIDFYSSIDRFLVLLTGVALLKLILDVAYKYQLGKIGELHTNEIREYLFNHQLLVPLRIYDEKGIGRYLLRFSGDLSSIQSYLTRGIIGFISDLFLGGIALVLLMYLNVNLGIVLLLCCAGIALIVNRLNLQLYAASVRKRNTKSGMITFVSQRLNSILTIKSFNRQVPENKRYVQRSTKLLRAGLDYHWIQSWIAAIIPFALYLMIGAVLFFIFQQQQQGDLVVDESTLLATVLILISMLPVFRRLFRVTMVWKKGAISYAKLCVILNLPPDDQAQFPAYEYQQGQIEIKRLSFGYTSENIFLKQLDFIIQPHTLTLITGNTGSGKTTIVKLLLGIIHPTQGMIELDGQSTQHVSAKSLRRKIVVVGEDWNLLGKTVFEAVAYSRNKEQRPRINALLKQLQAPLASHLRLEIDDVIGDYASNLSQGQRSILSFARALLTRKPIIILDAPFAGLDSVMAKHIAAILRSLKKKKTIIWLDKQENPTWLPTDNIVNLERELILNN